MYTVIVPNRGWEISENRSPQATVRLPIDDTHQLEVILEQMPQSDQSAWVVEAVILAGSAAQGWAYAYDVPADQITLISQAQLVGQRVKAAREAAGITQSELARRMGDQPGNISLIEAGKRGVGLRTLKALGAGLGVPWETL